VVPVAIKELRVALINFAISSNVQQHRVPVQKTSTVQIVIQETQILLLNVEFVPLVIQAIRRNSMFL
jgi:hypothetical protein